MTSTTLATADLTSADVLSDQSAERAPTERHTYGQILKSTALIGASSAVSILSGIVRTKANALFLGPAGVGLMGLYGSILDVTQSLAGMGIQSSGVRQIAEASGSREAARIARTVVALRWVSVLLGAIGAGLLIVFARPVARLTFASDQQATAIMLLSIAVFFRLVAAGQGALVQGLRRISDLARMGVIGAFWSTVISVPLVYFLREEGIVPSLVAVAVISTVVSWWYSRRVQVDSAPISKSQVLHETAGLLRVGFAFMASGFLVMGAAYAIRLIILRHLGVEAAGLYQSSWTIGGLYVGFILQAMGADFYPRLTAVASNNAECNRLVNEQAHIGLLLAGPGVIGTLTVAPLVIALFYSAKFAGAVSLLRWICLGMTLRVVAWPMGFIVIAKGAQRTFFWTEVLAFVVHVGLAWYLTARLGLDGAGAAFFGLYVWHGLLIYVIVRRMSGFRWSSMNLRTARIFLPLIGVVFCSFYLLPFPAAVSIGAGAAAFSSLYSLRALLDVLPTERVPISMRRLLARARTRRPPDNESAREPRFTADGHR
jgi:O-antigen/teichoic acid export membrane protein